MRKYLLTILLLASISGFTQSKPATKGDLSILERSVKTWVTSLFSKTTHKHDTLYAVIDHDHDTVYYTQHQVDSIISGLSAGGMLPGAILEYGGSSAPAGFLLCDGSSYLRSEYAGLFAVIGTSFGSADGTHFNVPDFRERFARGKGTEESVGDTAGSPTHSHDAHAYTPAGANGAPALTMNAYTPAGTNGAPALTMNAYTPAGTNNAPALTMNAYTPAGTNASGSVNSHSTTSKSTSGSGTTLVTTATHTVTNPTFTGTQATLTGSVAAPAFTGTQATLTGSVAAPAFTGTQATLTGSVAAPAFTGNAASLAHDTASNIPPCIVVNKIIKY